MHIFHREVHDQQKRSKAFAKVRNKGVERRVLAKEVLAELNTLGIDIKSERTLQRYVKDGLIPLPERRSAGRGRGRITDYKTETPAEFYASYKLRNELKLNVDVIASYREYALERENNKDAPGLLPNKKTPEAIQKAPTDAIDSEESEAPQEAIQGTSADAANSEECEAILDIYRSLEQTINSVNRNICRSLEQMINSVNRNIYRSLEQMKEAMYVFKGLMEVGSETWLVEKHKALSRQGQHENCPVCRNLGIK